MPTTPRERPDHPSRVAVRVDLDVGLRVGILCVRDSLCQNGGDVAVEVNPEMVERVQIDRRAIRGTHR